MKKIQIKFIPVEAKELQESSLIASKSHGH